VNVSKISLVVDEAVQRRIFLASASSHLGYGNHRDAQLRPSEAPTG